jgi:hypothetical protein
VSDPRIDIAELIYRYADRIDNGDFEGVADLLAQATISYEGFEQVAEGPEAILASYVNSTRRYEDGTPKTKHVMTNVIVDVDPSSTNASSRSYFTVLQAVPGQLALQPVISGRYHNRYERTSDGWHYRHMHIIIDLVGDLSQHMLYELPS